jgi:hypothetical protein
LKKTCSKKSKKTFDKDPTPKSAKSPVIHPTHRRSAHLELTLHVLPLCRLLDIVEADPAPWRWIHVPGIGYLGDAINGY